MEELGFKPLGFDSSIVVSFLPLEIQPLNQGFQTDDHRLNHDPGALVCPYFVLTP